MNKYSYDSIQGPGDEPNGKERGSSSTTRQRKLWIGSLLAVVLFIVAFVVFVVPHGPSSPILMANEPGIPMPSGVNLGSWLSLEDYFFADGAAKEVATPFGKTQAACLPPLHTGRWQSETDLLDRLTDDTSLADAIRVFHAHRVSFIDFQDDLEELKQMGIMHVRVPISWCLTDNDPSNGVTDENAKEFVCEDPFMDNVQWPAIPRGLIVDFLRACANKGITATLDIHTYPGATSIGTFSGLWPRWPRFWEFDSPESETDIGRQLLRDFVEWMESLAINDPLAFQGLRAISPMNEPAHLAGVFGPGDSKAFLPDLPQDILDSYMEELQPPTKSGLTQVPAGPHLRVMLWLRDAVQIFRESKLPSLGKQLHVNIHESIFRAGVLPPGDGNDPGGRHPGATQIIAAWWRTTTAKAERATWAVLDMHHYHAWEAPCTGTVDGTGNYTCGDVVGMSDALSRCTTWATDVYRGSIDKECGPGAKLASAEFSASTHHQVRHACNDVSTLRASYLAQVNAAAKAQVELFYWSYKMPYGGAFRSSWSFRQLTYSLGVTSHPDTPEFDCGQHVVLEEEPSDDIFS